MPMRESHLDRCSLSVLQYDQLGDSLGPTEVLNLLLTLKHPSHMAMRIG